MRGAIRPSRTHDPEIHRIGERPGKRKADTPRKSRTHPDSSPARGKQGALLREHFLPLLNVFVGFPRLIA